MLTPVTETTKKSFPHNFISVVTIYFAVSRSLVPTRLLSSEESVLPYLQAPPPWRSWWIHLDWQSPGTAQCSGVLTSCAELFPHEGAASTWRQKRGSRVRKMTCGCTDRQYFCPGAGVNCSKVTQPTGIHQRHHLMPKGKDGLMPQLTRLRFKRKKIKKPPVSRTCCPFQGFPWWRCVLGCSGPSRRRPRHTCLYPGPPYDHSHRSHKRTDGNGGEVFWVMARQSLSQIQITYGRLFTLHFLRYLTFTSTRIQVFKTTSW